MGQTLFTNVNIFDGNGKRSYSGEVLLQGNMIKEVAKGKRELKQRAQKLLMVQELP